MYIVGSHVSNGYRLEAWAIISEPTLSLFQGHIAKETYSYGQKRPIHMGHYLGSHIAKETYSYGQKRPIHMDERDLFIWAIISERALSLFQGHIAKVTYSNRKRDLFICQKLPIYMGKKDLSSQIIKRQKLKLNKYMHVTSSYILYTYYVTSSSKGKSSN